VLTKGNINPIVGAILESKILLSNYCACPTHLFLFLSLFDGIHKTNIHKYSHAKVAAKHIDAHLQLQGSLSNACTLRIILYSFNSSDPELVSVDIEAALRTP